MQVPAQAATLLLTGGDNLSARLLQGGSKPDSVDGRARLASNIL